MSGATSNVTHGAAPAAVPTTATTLVMAAASSGSGTTTTTVLSSAQATQLLQRLQQSQGGGVLGATGGGGHTIKIQAVQTHPQTGVRQIIAIPIHTTSAAQSPHPLTPSTSTHVTESTMLYASGAHANPGKLTISPMKAKMSGLGFGPNVKVVKIASSANLSGLSLVQSTPTQVNAPTSMITSHGSRDNLTLNNVLGYGTPGNGGADTPGSGSRKRNDIDFDAFSDAKRKKTEKGGKGLRHFSMKVCEKVQAKGTTSYNEVADELVAELTDPRCTSPTDQQYDQKNIRRRVYDALNVLMAMNIISKEKKEIRWLGLPTNSVQEANNLETIAFKNLVERNREREKHDGQPAPNCIQH
ncbi:hypothetical protein TCAL_11117 [Tigriopus californicus]|uniref:E2F/DP family winged-helix DNA-binding domain-containing protein n=1 Tax=Tigriopus californicus TaxID=6832 RepID=A0A553NR42_TIGCA|nr:hypothetical protein TCAL_11117 [Tigriopus californicus]